ncbi:MAG: flagellar export chaperone FlgN [Opitutaceae bacterium]|nr:flagellar export chaperone FlgN [Opitutaceae bacterium]
MTITWEHLAEHLRREVQAYGGLLLLFEEQQACVFRRDAACLLRLIDAIADATRAAERARREREQCVSAFAVARGRNAEASLRSLLPCIEGEARPLLEALIAEVNHLIRRVRRVARQDHLLLSRLVELQQDLLRQFYPGAFTQTYSAQGRVALATAAAPPPARQTAG